MTPPLRILVDPVARGLRGTRVLALHLLRAMAVLAGVAWVLLAPRSLPEWDHAATIVFGFVLYSAAVAVALWRSPGLVGRHNLTILVGDVGFALGLIHFTGGARSTLFLALLLIAALQSYYWGMRQGVLVALACSVAYLGVIWSTMPEGEWANVVIRLFVLLGTALGVGVLADIEQGERRKVMALTGEAQERERFVRSLLESLSDGVIALDPTGRVIAWNRAMADRHGVSADEVLGRDFFERFPEVERSGWAARVRELLSGRREEFAVESVSQERAGRADPMLLNVKGSLLREGGVPAGVVLLLEDVTERAAFERSARHSEKLAALGTLSAGLAHELNNPIGVISSRVELMMLEAEAQRLPSEMIDDLQVLHRHAQRVARIAQSLLSFSRQAPAELGRVDLNELVDETLLLIEKQVVKDGVGLKRLLAPGLPAVWGDRDALQQVLVNLLTNARDAVDRGGEILVETAVAHDRAGTVQLVVRDNGAGIPPDVLPRIFDPFFTTKPRGTGLGLSLSYGIVRDHHGTLQVRSQPGEGTTFTISLPVLEERTSR